jgi:uncharacterized protein
MRIPLLFTLLFVACGDKNSGPKLPDFERGEMLRNYAENVIRPAFAALRTEVNALNEAAKTFAAAPGAAGLSNVQTRWRSAYEKWQNANAFNFGPAGEEGLRKGLVEEIGTFPAAVGKIENAIGTGQWNFDGFDRDARGFIALEYLIFGADRNNAGVVTAFANAANRRSYLLALCENLQTRTDAVGTAWNGVYFDQFIQNDGTDVGSSTSQLYNELVRGFEALKNFKLGLPLGKRPGQTKTEPQLVEAYYSGASLNFLKIHLANIETLWRGQAVGAPEGIGFQEYLAKSEGGKALIASTEAQWTAVKNALAAVPADPILSEQIGGDKTKVETLYTELQKLTRYLKSDLSSLLGISITYSSGDGD